MTTVEVFAPAKINLALHVVGQRSDGYHLLDSLIAFASVGDTLQITDRGTGEVTVSGPEAIHLPAGAYNLIARQAQCLPAPIQNFDCQLEKQLPVASGMGGGSTDAAAFYRGAAKLVGEPMASELMDPSQVRAQWRVGADVPMCISARPARVGGIGEDIEVLPDIPALPVVLVNPRVPVPTGAVFDALDRKDNAPMARIPDTYGDPACLCDWLSDQRNDLQTPATVKVPVIAEVLGLLADQPGCHLARMSGSGASCFGIFGGDLECAHAAKAISGAHSDWWVRATWLDGHLRAAPQVIRSTT